MIDKIAVFDVETPNERNDSICSIGIVSVDENGVVDEFYTLVNPESEFYDRNVAIHHITPRDVEAAPTFPEVWEKIKHYFSDYLVVGHNVRFDLSCIRKTFKRYGIEFGNTYFVDTLELSRKSLTDVSNHQLGTLCDYLGITLLNHHNALDDCKATFELLLTLINDFGVSLDQFLKPYDFSDDVHRSRQKSFSYCDTTKYLQELQGVLLGITFDGQLNDKEIYALKYWIDTHASLKGNYPFDKIYASLARVLEDNIITEEERSELMSLFQNIINPVETATDSACVESISGKAFCLTGDFGSMSRKDFEKLLADNGAVIKTGVSKRLDYLIVGDLGSEMWAQGNYGTKIKKAKEINEKGGNITIIKECDFLKEIEI